MRVPRNTQHSYAKLFLLSIVQFRTQQAVGISEFVMMPLILYDSRKNERISFSPTDANLGFGLSLPTKPKPPDHLGTSLTLRKGRHDRLRTFYPLRV
jgi:hypothetical protein